MKAEFPDLNLLSFLQKNTKSIEENLNVETQIFSSGLRFARAYLNASDAIKLQSDNSIMLVDPLFDITESLKKQFKVITISDLPQPYLVRELKFKAVEES